jgi:ABC-type transport system involved in cytochrome bd biosynthesis fused ATPase/permease subunit
MSLLVEGLRSPLAGPFTFSVPRGQCLAISGASGSGKTVLLRMIADLDPHEGKVTFAGIDRASLSAPEWRRLAGLVPARSGWWAETVGEHFAPEHEATWQALATDLLLPAVLFERSVDEASTGERQRLGLIRALLAEPRLLLLDEPTASLDPASTQAVETVIAKRLAAGATVIWVTHDAAQASRMGSLTLHMHAGGVLAA